ncbi:hypothetical protein [Janthinobacterium sp. HLX7-2]
MRRFKETIEFCLAALDAADWMELALQKSGIALSLATGRMT